VRVKQDELPQNPLMLEAPVFTTSHTITKPMSPQERYQAESTLKAKQSAYRDLQTEILSETKYLKDMEAYYLKTQNPITDSIIQTTAIKLAKLHEQAEALREFDLPKVA